MSKSTPLTELTTDSGDAQPLVADILKEIEQDPTIEVADAAEVIAPQPQMIDTSDIQHQAEQQQQALQYQMDSQAQQHSPLQASPTGGHVPLDTIPEHPPEVMQMMQQEGLNDLQNEYSSTTPATQTIGQKIFEQARDPILVVLISVLLSVPAVYQTLSSLLSKIPGGSASLAPVILRSVLAGVLFFGIRKVL